MGVVGGVWNMKRRSFFWNGIFSTKSYTLM